MRVQVRIVGSVVLKTARNCLYFYTADVALSQKLQEELSYENETGGTSSDVPQFLKDFQAQNVWTVSTLFHVSCVLSFLSMTLPTEFRCGQISDVAGQDEVTLSRKFGNEESVFILIVSCHVVVDLVVEGFA